MAPGHTAKLHSKSTTEANTTCIKPINIPISRGNNNPTQTPTPTPTPTPDQANSQTANKVAAENGRRWQRTNLIYAQDLANYSLQRKKE